MHAAAFDLHSKIVTLTHSHHDSEGRRLSDPASTAVGRRSQGMSFGYHPPVAKLVRRRTSSARGADLRGEMAWVVLGQAVATAGGLAGVRILTHALNPQRYGELALGITLGTLAQLVAWSPISGAALRYFAPAQESLQLLPYLRAVRRLLVKATVALLVLGSVAVPMLAWWGATRWIALTLAAIAFTLLSGYEAALDSMQLAGRQRRIVAWHQGMSMWIRYLLALAFIHWLGPSAGAAMLGFAGGITLVLSSQLLFFHRRVLSQCRNDVVLSNDRALDRRMVQYAWPIAAWGLFSWVQAVSDRWILQGFTTTSTVGVYMALYQLGFYPMTVLSAVTLQFVSPVLFERAGDGSDGDRLNDAWRLVVIIVSVTLGGTAVATATTWLLHTRIFEVLVGADYRAASYLLPWMVCAGGLFATGQAASQALMVGGSTKRLILPKGIVAVVTLGLYTLGAYLRGLDGVIYANVIFGFIYAGAMCYEAKGWRARLAGPLVVPPAPASVA